MVHVVCHMNERTSLALNVIYHMSPECLAVHHQKRKLILFKYILLLLDAVINARTKQELIKPVCITEIGLRRGSGHTVCGAGFFSGGKRTN